MVTKETIREIIIDNRQQVAKREVVSRDFNFMDNACYVLIGVRRAGKSYLLYQRIQGLIRDGHSWDEIVYINFEDERLLEMQAADLNKILEVHQMMTDKMPLIFLDEIRGGLQPPRPGSEVAARQQPPKPHQHFGQRPPARHLLLQLPSEQRSGEDREVHRKEIR